MTKKYEVYQLKINSELDVSVFEYKKNDNMVSIYHWYDNDSKTISIKSYLNNIPIPFNYKGDFKLVDMIKYCIKWLSYLD